MKKVITLILIVLLGMYGKSQVCNPLDPGFGNGGKVLSTAGVSSRQIIVQPDGKIIQGASIQSGNSNDFLVLRYNSNGTMDNEFGTNGMVTASFVHDSYEYVTDLALQPDGKIIAAGNTDINLQGNREFALIRLNAKGKPDSTFGTNGKVISSLGLAWDELTGIALQPDGKIIAVGTIYTEETLCDYPSQFPKVVVLRYLSNGRPDSSFGQNGKIIISNGNHVDYPAAVAVQPDGKILVASRSYYDCKCELDSYYGGYYWYCQKSILAIQRFNNDGSVDNTFGKNGKAADSVLLQGAADLALQSDGKIIVTGSSPLNKLFVERYNADGTLDNSFANGGKAITDVGQGNISVSANSMAIQTNNKIILVGNFWGAGTSSAVVVRFDSNGYPDSTFNGSGVLVFNIVPPAGYFDVTYPTSVALQDNKIVVGVDNSYYDPTRTTTSVGIVRLSDLSNRLAPVITAGGDLDFCWGGKVILSTDSSGSLQWYRNNFLVNGATRATYSAEDNGSYTVVVNNTNGCGVSAPTVVTVNDPPPIPTILAAGSLNICEGKSVTLSTDVWGQWQWYKDGAPIDGATEMSYSATSEGSYSVTVSYSGCDRSSPVAMVTVNPDDQLPPVTSANGPLSFCEGGSVRLSSGTRSKGQWYLNDSPIYGATDTFFNAVASGSYTLKNACGTASIPIVVNVHSTPPEPSINWNGTEFSTNSGYAKYQWLLNGFPIPAATGSTYTPPTSTFGLYSVQVTTALSCTNVSDQLPYVVSGIADITIGDTRLRYYPNPTSKTLYLEIAQPTSKKLVAELYDFTGRLLQTQTLTHGHNEISVAGLTTGLYGLVINNGKEKSVRKLMVIK